jgi:threonylcarbamoyladenosine tRNA methylthiotransferase MtaB
MTADKAIRRIKVKVFFQTLGCKSNSYETQAMSDLLTSKGYIIVDSADLADIIVINSCTVTAVSDKKTRNLAKRSKKNNPDVITVLTGCLPQVSPDASKELGSVDIIMGNSNRNDIAKAIESYLESGERQILIKPHGREIERLEIFSYGSHTRAFLKIEDGCDRFCSYCIIPHARGRVRSLSPGLIFKDADRLASIGHREIVLTGINISRYGKDIGKSLADAVEAAAMPDGVERVRLSSLDVDSLDEELLIRLSKTEKLCPHFHLSLQSGSDSTLARMSRNYDTDLFLNVTRRISELFCNPTFTTDIIVGFPCESDEEFSESLEFVKNFDFLKCHVFPYSRRPGTPADKMPQIKNDIKTARALAMRDAGEESRKRILTSKIGSTTKVIAETKNADGLNSGYDARYIPVNFSGSAKRGETVSVYIESFDETNSLCIGRQVD